MKAGVRGRFVLLLIGVMATMVWDFATAPRLFEGVGQSEWGLIRTLSAFARGVLIFLIFYIAIFALSNLYSRYLDRRRRVNQP